MKIAIIGQQDFGKAVLEAFLARGDQVAGVFCAPEKPGAQARRAEGRGAGEGPAGLPVRVAARAPRRTQALKELDVDIGIMAFVLQFAPQDFVNIPKHGTIQYHPSLLPKYRGPSLDQLADHRAARRRPASRSSARPTASTKARWSCRRRRRSAPDDTLGTVYFDRLFPMGVQAMLEAADLVVAGKHKEVVQDESQATYEGWCREAEAKINWANHVDFVYNLIRGCNPAPGAWTTLNGKKLQIFDARKHPVRTFGAVKGKIGEVVEVTDKSFQVTAQGGRIEVLRAKLGDGKKVAAG